MASHYAAVRLDHVHDHDDQRLRTWLQTNNVSEYVIYREHGDQTGKLHYQGYIKTVDDVTFQSLKSKFKSWFSSHTRFQRSFTHPRKLEQYMIYVAKDKDLFCSSGVTDEVIAERESKSYKKDAINPKDGMIPRCVAHFSQDVRRYHPRLREHVIEWIVHDLKERERMIQVHQVRGWANSVCAKLSDEFETQLINEINSKM